MAAKHVYPDQTGSDSRGTSSSRTFELIPSEPMRRSHCTLEPLLSRPVTLLPGAEYWCFVYPVTSQPFETVPLPIPCSRISCNIGRSITTDESCPRLRAGAKRSKVANHSLDKPSLSPFFRVPMLVDCSRIASYTSWSMRLSDSSALLAIWIGPPKGR